jgi:protein-tyrosine phosphatase
VIDLHAHVLPGVDDGPASLDEAVALVTRMAQQGVTAVAASSHVSPAYPNTGDGLRDTMGRLRDALRDREVSVDVLPAGEIDLAVAMAAPDPELVALGIAGTNWLLLETPHHRIPAGLPLATEALRTRRFEVLIAHPERNAHLQGDQALLREAVDAGALVQVTGASLRGRFGRRAAAAAQRMVEDGLAHVVASDAHGLSSRVPDMPEAAAAVADRWSSRLADALTAHVPAAVASGLSSQDARALVPPARRRRSFGRLWTRT